MKDNTWIALVAGFAAIAAISIFGEGDNNSLLFFLVLVVGAALYPYAAGKLRK